MMKMASQTFAAPLDQIQVKQLNMQKSKLAMSNLGQILTKLKDSFLCLLQEPYATKAGKLQ